MSTQYPYRIDRDTAERLLDGDVTAYRDETDLLAGLLVAAAAPARPYELAGEQATLAAFRAAQLSTTMRSPRQSTARRSVMKLFTVKAAVLATAAVGGVAVAASFGTLPNMEADKPGASVESSTPGAGAHGTGGPTGAADPTTPGATGPTALPSPSRSHPGSPHVLDPAAVGLCRAYQARSGNSKTKALDSPAFADLITFAGGRDKVADYCQHLLATVAASEPTRGPKGQDDGKDPAGKPSQPPGG